MAARSIDPTRVRLNGPDAQRFIGVARTQMGILKELMGFGNLPQLSRTVTLADGTRIFVQSVFGQDTIRIDRPVEAAEEVVEAGVTGAVNRVADYVGVAMPNPVPYRGVSIGVTPNLTTIEVFTSDSGSTYLFTRNATVTLRYGTAVEVYSGVFSLSTDAITGYQTWTWANYPGLAPMPFGYPGIGDIPAVGPGGGYPAGMYINGTAPSGGNPIPDSRVMTAIAGYGSATQAAGGGVRTYVMASDGTALASELQNTAPDGSISYVPDLSWNGDAFLNMFHAPYAGTVDAYSHKLSFSVPEDCAYPNPSGLPYYATVGSWNDGLAEHNAGVAAFKARRKAWFLKNSTEFIAALKGGFRPGAAGVTRAELQTGMLPASWDYQIKTQIGKEYAATILADGSHPGRHTKMPVIMGITYTDTVQSDTSAGLAQAGTKVTQRAATFQYVDAGGTNRTATVNGTLTQVVTQHTLNGANVAVSVRDTYVNWYSLNVPAGQSALHAYQFLRDRAAEGLAQLWSGVVQNGNNATSAEGTPGNPLTYVGYSPAYPAYSNTLVGTAAALYLQYHNTVLPQYVKNTAQSSTVMNNSAMYNVRQIELCLFGPAPGGQAIGIFPDPTDADGATQIAYYGEASLRFDWTTGGMALIGWKPRKDANGNDAPTIIPMPAGYSYRNSGGTLYFNNGAFDYASAYNCAVGYVWDSPEQMWPDVAEYLRLKIAALGSGAGDQVLYTIIKQALAL